MVDGTAVASSLPVLTPEAEATKPEAAPGHTSAFTKTLHVQFEPLNAVPLAPGPPVTGERLVWAAVLEDALFCAMATTQKRIPDAIEALQWLLAAGPSDVGTARWVCEHLGIDHQALVERLLRGEMYRAMRYRERRHVGGVRHKISAAVYVKETVDVPVTCACGNVFLARLHGNYPKATKCVPCRNAARSAAVHRHALKRAGAQVQPVVTA